MWGFFHIYFTEIQLIYNVVLVSAIQQSDSEMHMCVYAYIYIYIYIYVCIHSFSCSFPLWFITGCKVLEKMDSLSIFPLYKDILSLLVDIGVRLLLNEGVWFRKKNA